MRPAIMIVEHARDNKWHASLVSENDGVIVGSGTFEADENEKARDESSMERLVSRVREKLGDWSFSGMIIVTRSGEDDEEAKVLGGYPVPVIRVPVWLAAAYACSGDISQFVLLETSGLGQFRLLRRVEDGRLESLLPGSRNLRELLGSRYEVNATNDQDLVLHILAGHPALVDTVNRSATGLSVKERLANIVVAQREILRTALADVLEPVCGALQAAGLLLDMPSIVCAGECFDVVRDVFEEVILGRMRARGSGRLPQMTYIGGMIPRHTGALRCAKAVIRRPGVWAAQSAKTLRLEIRTQRDIYYVVEHPSRYVFDKEEETLRRVIGARPVLAAVDARVNELYGSDIRSYLKDFTNLVGYVLIEGVEAKKTWEQVELVCREAMRGDLRRDGVMLTVGGGVTLDVVGFAAAVYRRGVPYLRVPTTLIGLVDVGVGVKQGVNFGKKKNILGAFYPAIATINDPTFLRTLSERDIACGIAEIVKMGIVRDSRLFELLESEGRELLSSRFQEPRDVARGVIRRAEQSMMQELQPNLYEADLQRLVDFGHSFSPTIEASSDYKIAHGEAVALDMLLSAFIAVQRRLCDRSVLERMAALYGMVGLPVSQDVCDAAALVSALDGIRAHRGGRLNLVLPTGVGSATFVQEVEYAEVHQALVYCALQKVASR